MARNLTQAAAEKHLRHHMDGDPLGAKAKLTAATRVDATAWSFEVDKAGRSRGTYTVRDVGHRNIPGMTIKARNTIRIAYPA